MMTMKMKMIFTEITIDQKTRSDGTGIHNGLKIRCPYGIVGSSPTCETFYNINRIDEELYELKEKK